MAESLYRLMGQIQRKWAKFGPRPKFETFALNLATSQFIIIYLTTGYRNG